MTDEIFESLSPEAPEEDKVDFLMFRSMDRRLLESRKGQERIREVLGLGWHVVTGKGFTFVADNPSMYDVDEEGNLEVLSRKREGKPTFSFSEAQRFIPTPQLPRQDAVEHQMITVIELARRSGCHKAVMALHDMLGTQEPSKLDGRDKQT